MRFLASLLLLLQTGWTVQYSGPPLARVMCSGTMILPKGTIEPGEVVSASAVCTGLTGGVGGGNVLADFISSPLSTVGYRPTDYLTIVKWPGTNVIDIAIVNKGAVPVNVVTAVQINYRGIE
jgi:hypothetical protein